VKKKTIHLFLRKSIKSSHFSIENFYLDIFKKYKNENYVFKFKYCPVISKGFFRRVYLIIWSYFNQGDINHILGDINFICLLMKKKKTINTILDLYSLKRLSGIKKIIFKIFWLKLPLKKSRLIITISNKIKTELIKNFNTNKKLIKVIDVSINKKFSYKKQNRNQIPNILIIGTSLNKNLENSIRSLKNFKCKLTIVGYIEKNYLNLLKNLNINYQNYVGISNNKVINLYKQSDILLFASIYEGFGIPILEAQKSGVPVVTSNLYPMKYVAGKGAYFVNPNNIKSIENGIKYIIQNKRLRKNLIKEGYKNEKRFNKDIIIQKYIECYNELTF
jgi:glycosyltransferase involved in cell wall biosynthesis|tara:strand:+ start:1156 stop:2154 length:999 start_codon:yes stop_codon:yes gene_type:complete